MNLRKTKIICTLGPAVDDPDTIQRLIRSGMNAARFNFSHGSHAEQLARLNMFKKVRDNMGAPVATILDTKGPEIRIRTFADGPITRPLPTGPSTWSRVRRSPSPPTMCPATGIRCPSPMKTCTGR